MRALRRGGSGGSILMDDRLLSMVWLSSSILDSGLEGGATGIV